MSKELLLRNLNKTLSDHLGIAAALSEGSKFKESLIKLEVMSKTSKSISHAHNNGQTNAA